MPRKKIDWQDDEDLQTIMICAVRYSLGRRTYMPGLVTKWIMGHMAGKMIPGRAEVMLRDIEEQRMIGVRCGRESLGDPCDVKVWERFEEWLKTELKQE